MDEFRDEASKGKSLERRLADSFAESIERDVNQMVSLFQQMLLETDEKRLDLVCREFKQMQPANLARAWRMVRKYKTERAMRDPSYLHEEAGRLKQAIEAMQTSPKIGAEPADEILDQGASSSSVGHAMAGAVYHTARAVERGASGYSLISVGDCDPSGKGHFKVAVMVGKPERAKLLSEIMGVDGQRWQKGLLVMVRRCRDLYKGFECAIIVDDSGEALSSFIPLNAIELLGP
jgi:hypothetical protein